MSELMESWGGLVGQRQVRRAREIVCVCVKEKSWGGGGMTLYNYWGT